MNTATSLRESARQAIVWSAGLTVARDVLQFVQMLVLARLLDPTTYGLAALTATFVGFIGIAAFQHIIPHVLQVPEDQVNYSEHFTAGLFVNGCLFVLSNLVAAGLRLSEQYAPVAPLLHLASVSFLIAVPADLRLKMLEREHAWRRIRNVQFIALLVSISSGISMALMDAGVYSLIVPGILSTSVIAADLLVVKRWRPTWGWDPESYAGTMKFGANRVASNALNGGRGLLQNTLITAQGQFATLGAFVRADAMAGLFCTRIGQQTTSALYPIITRTLPGSGKFQQITALALRAVAWTVIPIAAFASLEATPIVRTLYGHMWEASIPLVPWTMAAAVATSIGATAYSFLLANDQARQCLRSDTVAFVLAACTMLVVIPQGLGAYVMAAACVQAFVAAVLVCLLLTTQGIRAAGVALALLPPLAAAVAASGVAALMRLLLQDAPELAGLACTWVVFTFTYLAVLRLVFTGSLTELVHYLPGSRSIARALLLKR